MHCPEIPFDNAWHYDYLNGITGTTKLPNDLPETDSSTLILSNKIPTLTKPTSFFFRARHTSVKIYIGDKLMINTYSTTHPNHFDLEGIFYHELLLLPENSGEAITIESHCEVSRYLTKPGNIYLGDRGSFFIYLFFEKSQTLICAFALFIIALILLLLWLLSTFVLKRHFKEVLCLCLFTLSVSLWLFTESQCLQFFIRSTRWTTIFAYEILMIMPFPIALFFYYCSDRTLCKKLSQIAAFIPLIIFFINNLLHFLDIVTLANSLIVTQTMLAFETCFIAWIQITEIIYKRKNNNLHDTIVWKIPLIGIGLLVPMSILEICKYAFAVTHFPNDGILISLGVLFYILSLTVDSVLRLAYTSIKFKQAAEMKTQFLANMSHDIRTPLNAILGFNEVILRLSTEAKVKEYATNIQAAGKTLKDIINSILDITKIESGKLTIYSAPYNTLELLDNVISMCESLASKKGLQVVTHIDEHLPETLIGDETHICQVLTNIMSNAVKYTTSGHITFTVKPVTLKMDSPMCTVYFSVKDTGIGIKPEDKQRLFNKFERLDQEINYNVEGTGLGMSIVTQLLQAMDSKIELESEYGVGSNFYFTLPQCVADHTGIGDFAVRRQQIALENGPGVNFTAPNALILLVDDVQMNLDTACALLESTKIQVETALSGKQALEMVQKKRYHMILMDHMMPEMDGIETTQKIRALAQEKNNPYFMTLPILALTANAMVGMKETFISSGMQDFISKPIDVNLLDLTIKKWLPKELIEAPLLPESPAIEEAWPIELPYIDLDIAKQFNPTARLYLQNLRRYVDSFTTTKDKLLQLKEAHDSQNYGILVHALKSTSKLIGAMAVSDLAATLEDACHQDNINLILEETDHLLSLYEQCVPAITQYLTLSVPPPSKHLLSPTEYEALLARLSQAADSFDMSTLMTIEESLSEVSVPDDKSSEFEIIRRLISNVAFTELAAYLKKRL